MSIYSGFSTRNQETLYGKLCEDLVVILANRVLKALKSEAVDDSIFSKTLVSIYTKMGKLELHKYLPPKLSNCCTKLAVYCTSMFSLSGTESISSFSPSRMEYELPAIHEEPKSFKQRPAKSSTHTRGRNISPDRVPSSISHYDRNLSERKNKVGKLVDRREYRAGECVQLNDGMFYRLM
jgi:hypothetical protein